MTLVPSHMLGSPAAQQNIPCWPGSSRYVSLLTKGVERATSDLLIQMPFIFALLFIFDDFVGRVLHFIGYDNLTLLKAQYLYASGKLGDVSLIDFQILELTLWLSIAIWAARLFIGAVFLKEYDKFFAMFSQPNKRKIYCWFLVGALGTYADINGKLALSGGASFFFFKYLPRGYFLFVATMSFWYLWMISATSLFIIWKIFRQKRPGVVLWCDERRQEGLRS